MATVLGSRLRRVQHTLGSGFWGGRWQPYPGGTVECRRLLLCRALDELPHGSGTRHTRLVYGVNEPDQRGYLGAARRELSGDEISRPSPRAGGLLRRPRLVGSG